MAMSGDRTWMNFVEMSTGIYCIAHPQDNSFELKYSPSISIMELSTQKCSPLVDLPSQSREYFQLERMYRQFIKGVRKLKELEVNAL